MTGEGAEGAGRSLFVYRSSIIPDILINNSKTVVLIMTYNPRQARSLISLADSFPTRKSDIDLDGRGKHRIIR